MFELIFPVLILKKQLILSKQQMIFLIPFLVALVSAGVTKQAADSQSQASYDLGAFQTLSSGYETGDLGGDFDEHSGSDSNGAELTSLAHSSAVQANNAVQNQQTAGNQAAFGIATSFASAAVGVRRTIY